MTKLFLVDVSEHQGIINWEKLKAHIDGAIIRCGYGDDDKSQDDKQWQRNADECERLKIPYGVYLYSYADSYSHILSEIAHVKRLIKGRKLSYPVYIDLEESACGSYAVPAANAFCKAIEKAGYFAGVYTFESYYCQFMRGYNAYTLWIAKYGTNNGKPQSKPAIGQNVDIWQYSSTARIAGISDNSVDVNYCYRDFPAEIRKPSTVGTAAKVLEVARSQIGVTNGQKYGKWYEQNVDKDAGNYDFGAPNVPWCAMFASWCFNQAKAKCVGLPGAYCPTMLQAAKDAGRTVFPKNAKPGDVIYFDWDGGECDHVGICESNQPESQRMITIEGNTDNGIVARKTRSYSVIAGVARPSYKSSSTPVSGAPTSPEYRCFRDGKWRTWKKDGQNCGVSGTAIYDLDFRYLGPRGWYRLTLEDGTVLKRNTHNSKHAKRVIGVEIYYDTPNPELTGYYEAVYRVQTSSGAWLKWEHDDKDGGAGDDVNAICRLQLKIEPC